MCMCDQQRSVISCLTFLLSSYALRAAKPIAVDASAPAPAPPLLSLAQAQHYTWAKENVEVDGLVFAWLTVC